MEATGLTWRRRAGELAASLLASFLLGGCALLFAGADHQGGNRIGDGGVDGGGVPDAAPRDADPPVDGGGVDADGGRVDAAPYVVSVTPVDAASDVEPTTVVTFEFSEAMDATSVAGAITVELASGIPVLGTVTVDGTTATFVPDVRFGLNDSLSLEVADTATDVEGTAMEAPFASSFTVRDGAWAEAGQVHFEADTSVGGAYVALTPSGDGLGLWTQYHSGAGGNLILWMPFSAETGWGSVGVLPLTNSSSNSLGIDDTGRAILGYSRFSSSGPSDATVLHYDPSTGWGTSRILETSDEDASGARASVNPDGTAVAAFTQRGVGATNYAVHVCTYDPTTDSWSAPDVVPDSGTTSNAASARAVLMDDGTVIAVWYEHDGVRTRGWSSVRSPGGTWSSRQDIALSTNDNYPGSLVRDRGGRAYVTGYEVLAGDRDVWSHRYDPLFSGWNGRGSTLRTSSGLANYPVYLPDGAGNSIAVWEQTDGVSNNIVARRHSPVSGWGAPELIETLPGDAEFAALSVRLRGDAIAMWGQYDGTGARSIYANRYDPSSGWGSAFTVEGDTADGHRFPAVAMADSGVIAVLWQRGEGTNVSSLWGTSFR